MYTADQYAGVWTVSITFSNTTCGGGTSRRNETLSRLAISQSAMKSAMPASPRHSVVDRTPRCTWRMARAIGIGSIRAPGHEPAPEVAHDRAAQEAEQPEGE